MCAINSSPTMVFSYTFIEISTPVGLPGYSWSNGWRMFRIGVKNISPDLGLASKWKALGIWTKSSDTPGRNSASANAGWIFSLSFGIMSVKEVSSILRLLARLSASKTNFDGLLRLFSTVSRLLLSQSNWVPWAIQSTSILSSVIISVSPDNRSVGLRPNG